MLACLLAWMNAAFEGPQSGFGQPSLRRLARDAAYLKLVLALLPSLGGFTSVWAVRSLSLGTRCKVNVSMLHIRMSQLGHFLELLFAGYILEMTASLCSPGSATQAQGYYQNLDARSNDACMVRAYFYCISDKRQAASQASKSE